MTVQGDKAACETCENESFWLELLRLSLRGYPSISFLRHGWVNHEQKEQWCESELLVRGQYVGYNGRKHRGLVVMVSPTVFLRAFLGESILLTECESRESLGGHCQCTSLPVEDRV